MRTSDCSSLGSLSRRFVEILESAENGILNLNDVARRLRVPKRRVYDVTNVLEGVDLLEKISKNNVRWKRSSELTNKDNVSFEKETAELEAQIKQIEEIEMKIEHEIGMVYGKMQPLLCDGMMKDLLYVNFEDVRSFPMLQRRRVFAIKTPEDASLYGQTRSTSRRELSSKFLAESTDKEIQFLDVGYHPTKWTELDDGSKENRSKK